MTAEKPKKPANRPAIYGDAMSVNFTLRITKELLAKLQRLGGAAWVRAQIERAREKDK